MTTVRHFTASAIVLDDRQRVLLVHHNKLGRWLYPGGHIDPDEAPLEAAQREVWEETGVRTEVVGDPPFAHPAVTTHAPPYTIIEMDVTDAKVGPHRHIDLVYVLRATSVDLTAQLDEVGAARWVPIAEVATLDTPPELPALVADAAQWAKTRWPLDLAEG
jgi:8-oxo-dGTP pyrophosphatase MutT (NUDIX family)